MVKKDWTRVVVACLTGWGLCWGGADASWGASAAADEAGNYPPGAFTNGANAGEGLGPWQFSVGAGAVVDLASSAPHTGTIDSTNGVSFRFYGGTGETYAEAAREFNAALAVGDSFGVTLAYNYDGGNRGLSILRSGGELMYLQYRAGNTLAYAFSGGPDVVLDTTYVSTAVVEVSVQQLPGNALDVTITRNDGFTTNFTSGSLIGPATGVKFYNGGHAGDDVRYALFVNDLSITPSVVDALSLSGRDGMAAGMTNRITLSRTGTLDPLVVTVSNSAPSIASAPASVTFAAGAAETNILVAGLGLGTATLTAQAAGYLDGTLTVDVFDLGYDDASYYPPGIFEDVGNGGSGFQAWIIQNNNGAGDGYTNYAGVFLGDSTPGGGDVNTGGRAFGLYANGEGEGGPFVNAIRPFDDVLAVGQAVSLELGVNFRNGSKGAAFQNGGFQVFEFGAYDDDYFYKIGNETPVSLDWDYAADSAVEVDLRHVASGWYDITLRRRGSAPETNALGVIALAAPPSEVRLFNADTEPGDPNNLYVNRLARYSVAELPAFTLRGRDGMVAGRTNLFTVQRSGSLAAPVTVTLAGSEPGVVSVPATVEIPAGTNVAVFEVIAMSRGATRLTADAPGVVGAGFDLAVVTRAYDDATYYPPAGLTNGGNGGFGFDPWILGDNDGPGMGYTNYAGAFVGTSAFGGGNVDGSDGESFGFFANQDGEGGPEPLVEATRGFAELEVGEVLSMDLGVNFRNGAKGVMFQNGDDWLLEVAVYNDDYWYNVRDAGDNPVSLGWPYSPDCVIRLTLARTGSQTYDLLLTRSGSCVQTASVEDLTLSLPPDRARFYVFDTDSGDPANNLHVNRLAISAADDDTTDGIPNAWWVRYNIAPSNRIASLDLDGDGEPSGDEYLADTDPDDGASFFANRIVGASGEGILSLLTGPTTNSRVYDIWWTTNLLDAPQAWMRLGNETAGNGGAVSLTVTNDAPARFYRTGVTLP